MGCWPGLCAPGRTVREGGGRVVDYREPTLVVKDERGVELLHRAMPSYSKPGGPRCKGCEDCAPPLTNAQTVYGNRPRGVLLIVAEYHGGTDVCWEPD